MIDTQIAVTLDLGNIQFKDDSDEDKTQENRPDKDLHKLNRKPGKKLKKKRKVKESVVNKGESSANDLVSNPNMKVYKQKKEG